MKKLASFAVLAMMSGSLLAAPQPQKEEPRREPVQAGQPHKPVEPHKAEPSKPEPRKEKRAEQPRPPKKAKPNKNVKKTKKKPPVQQHKPAPRPDDRR